MRTHDLVIPHEELKKARLLLEAEFGFRRYATFNADYPSVEVMSSHGVRIWLVRQPVPNDLPNPEFQRLEGQDGQKERRKSLRILWNNKTHVSSLSTFSLPQSEFFFTS